MPDDERRPAIRVRKRIEIEYRSDSPPMRAHLADLSETGAYIDTPQPLPAGTQLQFHFDPGDETGSPLKGNARVVWTDGIGMGVEFLDLSAEDRDRLRFVVAAAFFDVPADLCES